MECGNQVLLNLDQLHCTHQKGFRNPRESWHYQNIDFLENFVIRKLEFANKIMCLAVKLSRFRTHVLVMTLSL